MNVTGIIILILVYRLKHCIQEMNDETVNDFKRERK